MLAALVVLTGTSAGNAQPLPVRLGYGGLSGGNSPAWMAKGLGLFDRHRLGASLTCMAATLTFSAMLAGETDFTIGTGVATVLTRLDGADTLILASFIVEGIWAFKANREAVIRAIEKYGRVTDRDVLEETYQVYRKAFQRVPRTTEAGVRRVLEAFADENPRARTANPRDFYTTRFVDELEQGGFIRELADRYPGALR